MSLHAQHVFELHSFIISIMMSQVVSLQIDYHWSMLFGLVNNLDVIVDLNSNTQIECPWMQIHKSYFDNQCQVRVCFYFFLDTRKCTK